MASAAPCEEQEISHGQVCVHTLNPEIYACSWVEVRQLMRQSDINRDIAAS